MTQGVRKSIEALRRAQRKAIDALEKAKEDQRDYFYITTIQSTIDDYRAAIDILTQVDRDQNNLFKAQMLLGGFRQEKKDEN